MHVDRRGTRISGKVYTAHAGNQVGVGIVKGDALDRSGRIHAHNLRRGNGIGVNRMFGIGIGGRTTAPVVAVPVADSIQVLDSIRRRNK